MLLVEFAAQNVKGFSPSVRIAMKSGYVVLRSPNESAGPFAKVLSALCYPEATLSDSDLLANGQSSGRVGLAIQTSDGKIFRLMRDLSGAAALLKLNPQTKQFDSLSTDVSKIRQLMVSQVLFPARPEFEALATLSGGQLPSRQPRRRRKHAPETRNSDATTQARASLFGMAQTDFGVRNPEETKARVALLERELVTSRQAAELQFRLDGHVGDVFKYESKLKVLRDAEARLEEARAEARAGLTPERLGLPEDIVARVARSKADRKRRDEALDQLDAEKKRALVDVPRAVDPLYREGRFVAALFAGAVLTAIAVTLTGAARTLALLAIPAFSFAGLLALRFIEDLQRYSREKAKTDVFDGREKKIRLDYELGNSFVQLAFEKTGSATDEEFIAAMAHSAQIGPRLATLENEFAQVMNQIDVQEAPAKIAEAQAAQNHINEELSKLSNGFVREPREIERELSMLRSELLPSPPPPSEASLDSADLMPIDDPTPALLALGAQVFQTNVSEFWSALRDRTVQYLTALSEKRCHGVEVDTAGQAIVQTTIGAFRAGELPVKDLDLYFLSLKLALTERYVTAHKIPVLVEDTFLTALETSKLALFTRMLKHIATLTQVIHVTGRSNAGPEFLQV
jgi:hypothetical protein